MLNFKKQTMNTEQKLDRLLKDVEKIKGYLENDTSTNTLGLVESHREIKRKVYAIEQRESVRKGKLSVWATIAGAIGAFLIWMLQELLGKKL